MRPLLLAAHLLIASTCAAGGGGKAVNFSEIGRGSMAQATTAGATLATDASTYASRWDALIGRGEVPAVDFSKNVVVFLLAGSKPTGGWTIDVRGVAVDKETLVVDAEVKGPPPDAMVTQAFTSPFVVIAVERRNVKDARWAR